MTETRQLAAGSLRFEDEDAVTAVPLRATQDPTATWTDGDAHFVPEDLLERECLGTWGQIVQSQIQRNTGLCEGLGV